MALDRESQGSIDGLVTNRQGNDDDGGDTESQCSSISGESFLQSTRQQSRVSTSPDDDTNENAYQHFTVRSLVVGLAIGILICFSNTYFGLQTGWISGMGMPAALIGFAFFKSLSRCISFPFSPVENVLVQTVAGAVGTMPLGCGFVGVVPALEFLLKPDENGPLHLSSGKLILWSLGICFFGVTFAIPLRKEVIIREQLKFPSGTATALMIGVLHGNPEEGKNGDGLEIFHSRSGSLDLLRSSDVLQKQMSGDHGGDGDHDAQLNEENTDRDHRGDWKANIKLLIYAFAVSIIYVS